MSVLRHGLVPSTGGYQIERSLRFNSADSTYLGRTPGSAGNRRKWTFSVWLKRTTLGDRKIFVGGTGTTDSTFLNFFFDSAHKLKVSGYNTDFLETTQVFRDVSAWYHLVLVADTDNSTSSDRLQLYVNGSRITAFGVASYPTGDLGVNNTQEHNIGRSSFVSGYFDGYMADVHFIDGSAKTPSDFGENDTDTGVWKPKAYTGSYGTNGFKLTFSDNSGTTSTTLGKDTSGNGNNWTPNNFSVTAGAGNDSLVDTPTPYGTDTGAGGEVRGNYATLNPLMTTTSNATITNGNLDVAPNSINYPMVYSTFGITSGKWYWEYVLGSSNNGGRLLGIVKSNASITNYVGGDANGWGYYGGSGNKYTGGSGSAYGASYTNSDVIGVAFDADAGTLVFYKNGSSQGTAFTGLTSGPYFPAWSAGDAGQSGTTSLNFGQRPFAYTAPSGFKALCTTNLPTPTIGATSSTRAGKYFNTVLFNSNSSGGATVTGVGFQPDFTWTKARNASNIPHLLTNVITGKNAYLKSNSTDQELTFTDIWVTNSDGFTSANGLYNNSEPVVAWNWKANGAGSSNTAGTITSTVSANTTAGFSIVTYTGNGSGGATVGHGLGVAPRMIIIKKRNSTEDWAVYHASIEATKYLNLNTTGGAGTSVQPWNNTDPTSSVFTLGIYGAVNASSSTYVAYCFAPVAGYSAFGSYTGNGSSDGVFIYTGFRPRYIMFKLTSGGTNVSNWSIFDTSRNPYNLTTQILAANASDAEYTTADSQIDILSNGIKIRSTTLTSGINQSGATYIYAAFAEVPQKFSLAR